jgi:polyphosphate kinase 2 (PPK2 family)
MGINGDTQAEKINSEDQPQETLLETAEEEKNSPALEEQPEENTTGKKKLKKKFYEQELSRLQVELVKLQEWVKHKGLKVVVVFEGRDAAGKGGVIKRISQVLNPRYARVVALGVPT